MVSRRSLLRQQPERIKAFVRAYVAAIKVVNEDAVVSKRALAKYLATTDGPIIEEATRPIEASFRKYPT